MWTVAGYDLEHSAYAGSARWPLLDNRPLVSTGLRLLHNPQTCALALHRGSRVETELVLQSATEKDDSVVASGKDATLGLSPSAYPCDQGKPFNPLVPRFPHLFSSLIATCSSWSSARLQDEGHIKGPCNNRHRYLLFQRWLGPSSEVHIAVWRPDLGGAWPSSAAARVSFAQGPS